MKQFNKISIAFLTITSILVLNGCKVLNPSQFMRTSNDYKYDEMEEDHSEYVINLYDKLDVRVYTNNGFQLIDGGGTINSNITTSTLGYLVESDSTVKLPVIGRVNLVGMTIPNAEAHLEALYQQYYQQPFVKLSISNRRVLLFKAGSTSGTVLNISNEKFTLIEALAQVGGLSDISKAYKIKVVRGDLKNPKVFLYNISTVEDMRNTNLVLQSNDIIYVETKPKYVQRTLSEITPYISLINTIMLIYLMTKNF